MRDLFGSWDEPPEEVNDSSLLEDEPYYFAPDREDIDQLMYRLTGEGLPAADYRAADSWHRPRYCLGCGSRDSGYSTAFTATETQGTSNVASSVLVGNANRILLPMRVGLMISQLDQRWADSLQLGFIGYLRHDWEFPYSAAMCRVLGILTT